jgi:RNA polymerase sigma-70 factor (ECF subfamily)
MVRLSDGDRTAFQVLLDELWPVILSLAQRGVGNQADAEDIAQEVFFRICSRIADYDRTRDGLSWAFGIASYEIMTQRRRVQRRREVTDAMQCPELVDRAASQEEALLHRELLAALAQAVGDLSDEDRSALGLNHAHPATDLSAAALRKRRQRALDRLRGIWRKINGHP